MTHNGHLVQRLRRGTLTPETVGSTPLVAATCDTGTEIGLSCVLATDRGCPCRTQYTTTIRKGETYRQATDRYHREAGALGWVIGIDLNAQAHYACPEHADFLIDAMVLK